MIPIHRERDTILQRQLLNALLATLAVTALIGALLPLTVLAASENRSENCPAGYDHKSDPPENLTTEWGSATLANGGSAVSFYVKDGYTVDVCVKGGNEGFDIETIVGEETVVVATPTDQAVSHYEWSFSTTATTTTTEGSTTSTTTEASTTTTDSSTTTEPTLSSTTTTTTTTAPSTTSTSDPATTTSTTEPSTTSTIQSSSSTTSSDEVLDSTLPFTGGPTDGLPILALSLLASGILIVAATRRRTW